MKHSRFRNFRNIVIGMIMLTLCIYLLVAVIFVKGCNHIEKKGDGSLIKGIGKELREVKEEFNEGYNDTIR